MGPKMIYDPEVNILSIRLRNGKCADSDFKDNVVFDFDKKGHLINIEILDFNIEALAKSPSIKFGKKKNGKLELALRKN